MELLARAKSLNYKWLIFVIAIFLISAILVGTAYYVFAAEFRDKIYPNIFVGKENIGGLTKAEALKKINQHLETINQNGIVFAYQENKTVILPTMPALTGEFTEPVITFDAVATVDRAFSIGRGLKIFMNFKNVLWDSSYVRQTPLITSVDQEKIKSILKNEFSSFEQPAKNAALSYEYSTTSAKYNFSVTAEVSGKVADYETALEKLTTNLINLNNSAIVLSDKIDQPTILKENSLNITPPAEEFLAEAPFTLKFGEDNKKITPSILVKWLALTTDNNDNKKVIVGLDVAAVKKYLQDNISPLVDKKPQNSKFAMSNGRVTEFQSNQDGTELDLEESFNKISDGLKNNSQEIELAIKTIRSEFQGNNVNELGVEEIIGTGHSNFAGSPKNRRHNIKVGADALHGVVIKPGEKFSVMETLGEIDASSGYLTELVIKQNKTTPEYGGGLCQIGTTMFRTALASGLPITMRRNHSYRVTYYEPAGTDATIYDPWPDLKFINDTGNYILIQSRINGDNLYFDFWGKKDGRVATTTYPKIYNIVKPKPAKIVETLDLKPGEKKCTEKAHNGADAYFDYSVVYPNGEKKEERFSSHYVPWQEVCLLGVEKLTTDANISTSTATIDAKNNAETTNNNQSKTQTTN